MRSIRTKQRTMFIAVACVMPVALVAVLAWRHLPEITRAAANFFATNPDKAVNIDRGYSSAQTSQLNVYDEDATDGYIIKARLDASIDPNFTVRISSADSTTCTGAKPCQLSTTNQYIYGNATDSASVGAGDVLDFDVLINSSMGLGLGAHDINIIYTKERAYTMQAFKPSTCAAMPVYPTVGAEIDLSDSRDGTVYKVRKLADNKCWMVDNLVLAGTAANPLTLNDTNSDMQSGTYSLGVASNPNGGTYCAALDTTIYPHKCGLQYTWTVAVAGNNVSSGAATNSICPKNWHLPTNGEYGTIQSALGWGSSGANVNNSAWRGLYNGYGGTNQGSWGYYWSSSAYSAANAYYLVYGASAINTTFNVVKTSTYSIRCLAR